MAWVESEEAANGAEPPTPAWRERAACVVELRRVRLAIRGRKLLVLAPCSLGCGKQAFCFTLNCLYFFFYLYKFLCVCFAASFHVSTFGDFDLSSFLFFVFSLFAVSQLFISNGMLKTLMR